MKNNDIEILNFDDEENNTKKKDVLRKKVLINEELEEHLNSGKNGKKKKIDKINKTNNKKKKEKRKYGVGEKVFIIASILFIIGCFIFYGYRTYHYYHTTHDIVQNISLKDKLTALTNIAYQNDGLYENSGYFYYKGVNVNNYVYYSGRLFRIIDINNDGIRMIEADTETNLVWTIDSNYEKSYVHEWLKDYLKTLKDYDLYLVENKWCNDRIDLEDYKCDTVINDYVGLLSTNDYLQAGGKNSYLNNETYFWTINQDRDGNVYYVNNEGGINNVYKKDDTYYSYGIRPVITIKEDTKIMLGSGTEDDPFIIEKLGKALLNDNSVGSYVEYKNELYRIIETDDSGTTLMYDEIIEVDKKYNEANKYLNSEFIKNLDKNDLVKIDYYVNEYSSNNKYQLANTSKKSDYVISPSIGGLFLNSTNNYWLNNYSDDKLGLYYTLDENNMLFADLSSNEHYVRPIIKLKENITITGGSGLKVDPLMTSKEGEDNVEKN